MENPTEEEPNEFLEPVEEIVESVEQHVEHEEVLEEIVDGDEMMYDADGRLVEYQNVVVYEDGSEVIEEYVEVEDMGNGTYAYVMTDVDGNRRLLKAEEVESVKKELPMLEEEFDDAKADEAGPSTSGYAPKPRGRFPTTKPAEKSSRATMRDLLGKSGAGMMYVDRGEYHYHESPTKGMTDLAKVDVEKYVPTATVNRRPLPDNADFIKTKQQRSRKNPPWQDDQPSSSRPVARIRSTSPIPVKEPLYPDEDDMIVRFKCNECDAGFAIMERLCEHMSKNHECQTIVRELQFFNERDFEAFLFKVEKQSLEKEADPHKTFAQSRKSRTNSSQMFVCNYMNKKKSKYTEFTEVNMATLADRPMDACTAFIQKTHTYESIRVKYCDHHVHYDGNIGFRVPISVKRRLFELSIKRLPVPCMQVLLSHEAESLLTHPTRFEEKLKNISHLEVVELLGLITANLPKTCDGLQPIRGKRVPVKFESITSDQGQETLVVVRANPPSPKQHRRSVDEPLAFSVDDEEDVPMMAREEEVEEEEEEPTPPTPSGGVMDEKMLYDPVNRQDPRLDELSETELGILEAYERDIGIELSEDQRETRNKFKSKYQLAKVLNLYNSLDAATHGLSSNELHIDTINKLRDMASYVVELVCTLDAEIRVKDTPAFHVDEIKRDMIAGIAMQERVYQPDRRRRSGNSTNASPIKPYQPRPRTHEEYTERIFSKVKALNPPHRTVGINMSGTFDLNRGAPDLRQQLEHLHPERLLHRGGPLHETTPIPEEQKPSTSGLPPLPEAYKAVPWSKPSRKRVPADPNAPARKRGRPNKKSDVVVPEGEITSGALIASDVPPKAPPIRRPPAPEVSRPAPVAPEPAESPAEKPIATPTPEEPVETAPEEPTESREAPDAPETSVNDQPVKKDQKEIAKSENAPEAPATPSTVPSVSSIPTPTTTTRTGRIIKPKKWGDE